MLSRFVIAFLPTSKCFLILQLQLPSTVILEFKKIKSVTIPLNKGQKQYRSNRSRRYEEEVVSTHGRTIQKGLNDLDNHDGVITHLQPDILECEVKWALGSITINKASGGNGIPVELFEILKDDAVNVLCPIFQQIWKTQQLSQDWKKSVFIPIPKNGRVTECSNYWTIVLFPMLVNLYAKSLK